MEYWSFHDEGIDPDRSLIVVIPTGLKFQYVWLCDDGDIWLEEKYESFHAAGYLTRLT